MHVSTRVRLIKELKMRVALKYIGTDEKLKAKLEKTGGVQMFEKVDADEIMKAEKPDYEFAEEGKVHPDYQPAPTRTRPMSTQGKAITSNKPQAAAPGGKKVDPTAPGGEGKTDDELREALKAASINFPADARRPELVELYDRNVKKE